MADPTPPKLPIVDRISGGSDEPPAEAGQPPHDPLRLDASVPPGPNPFHCQFRHESSPPVQGSEWIVAFLLLIGAAGGLGLSAYGLLRHASPESAERHKAKDTKPLGDLKKAEKAEAKKTEEESDLVSGILAFVFALSCGMFGFSLLWIRRLWSPNWKALRWFSDRFPHLPHEVGMAFVVGAVVFVCVELTLRVAEERSTKKTIRVQLDTQLNAFHETLKLKDKTIEEAKLDKALVEEANKALKITKAETVTFLNGLALTENVPIEPILSDDQMAKLNSDLTDTNKAYKSLQVMASDKEFDGPTLRMWESVFLDGYGRMQRLAGDFGAAEASFRQALTIDKGRFERGKSSESRQWNLLLAYDRSIGIAFCQMDPSNGKREQAIADQKAQVVLLENLARTTATKNHLPKANDTAIKRTDQLHKNRLARLEELEKTSFLPNAAVKWIDNRLTVEDELIGTDPRYFGHDPRIEGKRYTPRCKVYALRLDGGKTYRFRAMPKGDTPIDILLLLQTGLFNRVREADSFGAGKSEEFTVAIRHSETYRLFVASSPIPVPESSPDKGRFTLTVEAVPKEEQ